MLASGCSNAPGSAPESTGTGTIDLPLTAQANGIQYRLAKAKFTITGTSYGFTRLITPAADLPIDQEVLPSGDYSIVLADGWQLQAKGPSDSSFSNVDAQLVENPLAFTVTRGQTVDVVFVFISSGIPIKLSKGRANVRISVSDCSGYDGYTATLAGLTVDCLGTVDQNSYVVDDNGYLTRNFDTCQQTQQLSYNPIDEIDAVLGLQYDDREPLPFEDNPLAFAKDCIGGRWAQWRESFDSSGTTDCPAWIDSGSIQPSADDYQKLAGSEPVLPAVEDGSRPTDLIAATKINSIYRIAFSDNQNSDQKCGSAGDCAKLCAGGFAGFVIGQDGDSIITDPPPWNDPTVYPQGDPYQPSYYHMMSFYGPLPGALFGAAARADAEDECSVYVNGTHQLGTLIRNCRISSNGTPFACVGVCTPQPVLQ
jgi:hypothetical protein